MRKNTFYLLRIPIVVFIVMVFLFSAVYSQSINVKDYIKEKFPSIFSLYLSSLEDLNSYEKEFIDLLEKLPEEKQEYYAKEVYKNGFSLELLEKLKKGKTSEVKTKEKPKEEVSEEGVALTPTPKTPEELIDIHGSVTIADKIKASIWEYTPEEAGNVLWIVDITATNRNYEGTLTSNSFYWYLIIDEKVTHRAQSFVPGFSSPELNLSIGETGETRFIFVMPTTADAGNTKLAYQKGLLGRYFFGDIEIVKRTYFINISKSRRLIEEEPSGRLVEEEPMEISGYVTITDKVKAGLWEYTPKKAGNVIWVVDVNVKNKYFEDGITSNFLNWYLVADGVRYTPKLLIGFPSPKFNLSLGESGSTRFVYELPASVSIGDAKLGYKVIMSPYFFGELEGGGKVKSLVIEE